jgi:hypothetical protein
MTQIEKHEKAIKILLAIQECEHRITNHKSYIENLIPITFVSMAKYYSNRVEINTKIKSRLENYYKNFKI